MAVGAALNTLKVGVLFDFVFPPPSSWNPKQDFLDGLRLTFDEALSTRLLDRPVELVIGEAEGLPRGEVKAVIDAYADLVHNDGCLMVIGPMISENAIALKEYIERDGRTPTLSWCGTDDWLGEWTFHLSNGSLPDEPYVLANLVAHAGHHAVAVVYERSSIGQEYLDFFLDACSVEGLAVTASLQVAQTETSLTDGVRDLEKAHPDVVVFLGFGLGILRFNTALEEIGWDPPRYMTTAWENGFINDEVFGAYRGWIGLEQYDEGNPVAAAFLDRFNTAYGRRPEYFVPGYAHDVANAVAHALSNARPLSPTGVKEGLERVKMLPAASGAAGTRISFGKWTRRGWMGAGYLIAREVAPDLRSTHFRGRLAD